MAAEKYRYTGNKAGWDKTERRILEGSSTNPKRYVDLGGIIELSEEEADELRSGPTGAKLTKLNDEQVRKVEEQEKEEAEAAGKKRGSQQQVATGSTAPAATPDKDKRPGAPGADSAPGAN